MRLAALFSGGKDSTYSIYQATSEGHEVVCLVTVFPKSEESMLLHHPNIEVTKLLSTSMRIPQVYVTSDSNDTANEVNSIFQILKKAKIDFQIEGLVHGGISSVFQKKNFENLCKKLDLKLFSPVWNLNPHSYMKQLLEKGFCFMITSVTSEGLDDSWLGKIIDPADIENLSELSKKHGFNLNFEGGEAETLVVDCPLYSYPLEITNFKKIWDGYRGKLEIIESKLDYSKKNV
ncbi:MAG: diphthine--ammonia ligase [Crenarchaeota archaeon]|nr:MAG: diphthine--ammonia ligase [Thermoproteota archaeon]RDJ33760.1 MAG: diphthine--ammonia ligase [Thermoproteota archaeon]RDJ37130.1 MAG: diphthine--ammonia ligase [Thermoproteota archaeon]RDJ37337.1 MAG: diphthine--ammonia ligase [Thermoproteota archaeon]